MLQQYLQKCSPGWTMLGFYVYTYHTHTHSVHKTTTPSNPDYVPVNSSTDVEASTQMLQINPSFILGSKIHCQ